MQSMLSLIGCEIEPECAEAREEIVRELRSRDTSAWMVLNTCQRLECYGWAVPEPPRGRVIRVWNGGEAFERLARIAAGLESRILGELEVLGQVREAYRVFREAGGADDTSLDRIFQEILAVARRARRESRIDQTLISLSALASRELLARIPEGAPVAVIGSGSLASSVIRHLAERGRSPLRIAGRCPENALRIANEVRGFGAGMDNLAPMLEGAAGIVAATAAPHPVLYLRHLEIAARPLVIVDLGVPPDCSADIPGAPGVQYLSLGEVEARAQVNLEERRRQADWASAIVREGAREWAGAS